MDPKPVPPIVTAEVTQIPSSATDASVTVAVHNAAPPSRPETTVPITGAISGFGTFAGSVTFPAIDTHYSGTVTLDIPAGVDVLNLEGGPSATADGAGTHLAYSVPPLDGGADWTTGFDLAVASPPIHPSDPDPATPIAAPVVTPPSQ